METHEVILEIPLEHERNLFGGLDCHVKKIERTLRVSVILRDGAVKLVNRQLNRQKMYFRSFLHFRSVGIRLRSRM